MSDFPTKEYKRKTDTIKAYQIPKGSKRINFLMNQCGWYDPGYHNNITTQSMGYVEAEDYVVEYPNGIVVAMRKEDFEALFEPVEGTSIVAKVKEVFKKEEVHEISKVELHSVSVSESSENPITKIEPVKEASKPVYEGTPLSASETLAKEAKPKKKGIRE